MITMKKKILQNTLVCLLMSVMISCATQQPIFLSEYATIRLSNNTITSNDRPILRVAKSVLNLEEKKLFFEKDSLPKNVRKYISTILRECHSSQDTLVAISQDFIVSKGLRTSQKQNANYLYRFDFEIDRWICSYIADPAEYVPPLDNPFVFFRKVYVVERRNRIIVKDYFGDISVIYVIQGRNKEALFNSTSVWNPSEFPALISTAYYIQERLDPISHNIAKNKTIN